MTANAFRQVDRTGELIFFIVFLIWIFVIWRFSLKSRRLRRKREEVVHILRWNLHFFLMSQSISSLQDMESMLTVFSAV